MGTFREELPIESEHFHEPQVAELVDHTPEPFTPPKVHTHDDIVHAGQPSDQSILDLLISDRDMEELWGRINQAQKAVNRYIPTLHIAQPMLDQIQAARNELMAGKENYEDAERHLGEVEHRIRLSQELDKWSKTLIPGIFAYLAIWFIGLVIAIFVIGENIFSPEASPLVFLAGSMIWGGVGGIIGALLPLIKHFSEKQDFTKRFTWWYLISPFVGTAMGAIIYLFMSAGILAISSGDISSPVSIYILAGLAGYQHNVFTDLVKRMLKVLQVEKTDNSNTPKTDDKTINNS
nr:hypothetical protein [Chloroflexota bacterium]